LLALEEAISFVTGIFTMYPIGLYFDKTNYEVIVWVLALIIVLMEFHYVKDFLVFIFMKLYEFFIQRNAEGL
jgi:hypothetical protein